MPKFTNDQQKVIDLRNRDILVSAAAGSGKTTVLVERIIQLITEGDAPYDIDHLLVVTFTRAAAREMREKIREAIEKKSKEEPTNAHLKKQASYVFHSQITTIDSFCNYLVKNYFYTIDLEPDFRILDKGEYTLIEAEVIDEMLEDVYGEDDPRFVNFADAYSKGNSDAAIVEMILDLANEAMTNPWPFEWLDSLLVPYELESVDEVAKMDFIADYESELKGIVEQAYSKFLPLYNENEARGVKTTYDKAMAGDYQLLNALKSAASFDDYHKALFLSGYKFEGLGNGLGKGDDADFRAEYKEVREVYKSRIEDMKDYFAQPLEGIYQSFLNQKEYVETLVYLAKEFIRRRQEHLEKINAWQFSDIEHFALHVLVDESTKEPTDIAKELRVFYKEIMVDEYQDSNFLQEEILRSITGETDGHHNYFMVGDVKQSIYRFRQARPEIFSEKYNRFSLEDSKQQRIELDQNFRSRKEVLDATNDVFLQIMDKSIGNVSYDDTVSLKLGADYYPQNGDFSSEVLIGIKDKELLLDADLEDKSELEAVMVANRITDLMKSFLVYDKDLKEQRPIRYSDIVILLRSHTNAQTFVDVLSGRGIPTFAEKNTGYFSAMEVQTVLSFLQILDNPRQDIPLVSVLHSEMFGFSNEELAVIRNANPKGAFYKAFYDYAEAHEDDKKINSFISLVSELRSKVEDTPIHILLQEIYERTGFLTYVYSLPAGENRRSNLYKLIDLAIKFETTSFKGLFRFCNYIRRLRKYESDMGEAELISEDDDAVRIMTIHHSKGLEFPVVFLSETAKKLNLSDASGKMILHSSKGIALDEISLEKRTQKKPLFKKYIADCIKNDSIGEEMRILYVAMTRAKEKLIVTATFDEDKVPAPLEGDFTNEMRKKNTGYAGWIIPILQNYPDKYHVNTYYPKDFVEQDVADVLKAKATKSDLMEISEISDDLNCEVLENHLNYLYPYEVSFSFKGKYSVSELKHKAMELNEDPEAVEIFSSKDEQNELSNASKENVSEVSVGALKGTAMHRFMECFNFSLVGEEDNEQIVHNEVERLLERGLMKKEDVDLLDLKKLISFLDSDLAVDMKKANQNQKLKKEQPFVMGDTPKNLLADLYPDQEYPDDEKAPMVLIQGIIDAFYINDDGIVLVDYKTDRVSSGEELILKYREQMDLYQRAIEKSFHQKVVKRVLYSFSLGEEVVL